MKLKGTLCIVLTMLVSVAITVLRCEPAYTDIDKETICTEIRRENESLHDLTSVVTSKESICSEECLEAIVSDECDVIVEERYFDTISMLENNSIYIEGTDINKCFSVSSFSQTAVDNYDIVYTEDSELGANNPFVLGHNYGSLGILDQTKVGQNIYLCKDGVTEIYEVVVSEYGLQNSMWTDIIGQSTGTSIWENYDCKTLHMYTCYGSEDDGRWMVLATLVSNSFS